MSTVDLFILKTNLPVCFKKKLKSFICLSFSVSFYEPQTELKLFFLTDYFYQIVFFPISSSFLYRFNYLSQMKTFRITNKSKLISMTSAFLSRNQSCGYTKDVVRRPLPCHARYESDKVKFRKTCRKQARKMLRRIHACLNHHPIRLVVGLIIIKSCSPSRWVDYTLLQHGATLV